MSNYHKKPGLDLGICISDKHSRYQNQYKSNDYFWGIGIENETYLQFSISNIMSAKDIYEKHTQERYSVNYFSGLNPEYKNLLKKLYPVTDSAQLLANMKSSDSEAQQMYDIPCFINAHTLQKTDISGNHETTYEKEPKPNPKFKGQTIHDVLCLTFPQYFQNRYKVNYMYDGDTIEFMTQNFYKTTVKNSIDELLKEKSLYLKAINKAFKKNNIFQRKGELSYPTRNEPFVSFMTNPHNITTFNNGTYHFNFTLPTQLNSAKKPVNQKLFVDQHKAAIRFIQYLEPLLIAIYGTPDPFSLVSDKYSAASQRCAVSRYIGIGTYNTETMLTGKVLAIDVEQALGFKKDYWWYTNYTKDSHYTPLTRIGVDINFNKHGTHGIEIRFLDWFPEEQLEPLMNFFVHVLDFSLLHGLPTDPTICPIWNRLVVRMLKIGKSLELTDEEFEMYSTIFKLQPKTLLSQLKSCIKSDENEVKTIPVVYRILTEHLNKVKGICSKYMLGDIEKTMCCLSI